MTIRCAHCGSTKFGLIRYRIGMRRFCKKTCRDNYRRDDIVQYRKRQSWFEYLMRPN